MGLKNSAPVTVGMDEKSRNRIFETIEKSIHLERLLLLGGEPFINTFHYEILEYYYLVEKIDIAWASLQFKSFSARMEELQLKKNLVPISKSKFVH